MENLRNEGHLERSEEVSSEDFFAQFYHHFKYRYSPEKSLSYSY